MGVVTSFRLLHRSKMHGHISPVKAGFSLENRKSQRNWLKKRNICLHLVLYLKSFNCISFPGTRQGYLWRKKTRFLGFLKEQVAACRNLLLLNFSHGSFFSFFSFSHLQLSMTRSSRLTSGTTRNSNLICLRFLRARPSQPLSFGSTRTALWEALKTKPSLSASTKCCRNIRTGMQEGACSVPPAAVLEKADLVH